MKRYILDLELKSQLCSGSGYSFAGVVDTDICSDSYGIPYIPAKRLKGCLREAADIALSEDKVIEIFGKKGSNSVTGLYLGNAYLTECEAIERDLEGLSQNKLFKNALRSENVLSYYSVVRGQTKISPETGTAKANTLRFTRMMNQYDEEGKPYHFQAVIEYKDDILDELVRVAKALRNIGIDRNRGLGSVKATCKECKDEQTKGAKFVESVLSDGRIKIDYTLYNEQPLMLSRNSESASENYISGQMMLGAVASLYLDDHRNSPESDEFKDIFLNGKTCWLNAYPGNSKEARNIPAPEYIGKLKKTKKFVNLLYDDDSQDENDLYYLLNGNQPKKLKKVFVAIKDNSISVFEVKHRLEYHHSKNQVDELQQQGIFYSSDCLAEGQYFHGSVITPREYVERIKEILSSGQIRLGKSRTAQYGKCSFVDSIESAVGEKLQISSGKRVVITFVSDAIFSSNGVYLSDGVSLKKRVAEELGIKADDTKADQQFLTISVANGYSSIWNARRESIPVVKAGSAFVYTVSENTELEALCQIGMRKQEGYGEVQISVLEDRRSSKRRLEASSTVGNATATNASDVSIATKSIVKSILLKRINDQLAQKAIYSKGKLSKISASSAGRLSLMLKESLESSASSEAQKNDLKKRIESIKRDNVKSEVMGAYKAAMDDIEKVSSGSGDVGEDTDVKALYSLMGAEDAKSAIESLWAKYLMNVLTVEKYEKSAGRGQKNDD